MRGYRGYDDKTRATRKGYSASTEFPHPQEKPIYIVVVLSCFASVLLLAEKSLVLFPRFFLFPEACHF